MPRSTSSATLSRRRAGDPVSRHAPVETKVTVAAAVAYLSTVALLGALAAGQRGQLVDGVPDPVAVPLLSLVPGGLTFRAGWLARHTPRMARR